METQKQIDTDLRGRFAEATCCREEYAACAGVPSLWESHTGEHPVARKKRYVRAVELCEQCPALDACRERTERYTAIGLDIDGVVAGLTPQDRSKFCARCGRKLYRLGRRYDCDYVRLFRDGMCRSCYRAEREAITKKKDNKQRRAA